MSYVVSSCSTSTCDRRDEVGSGEARYQLTWGGVNLVLLDGVEGRKHLSSRDRGEGEDDEHALGLDLGFLHRSRRRLSVPGVSQACWHGGGADGNSVAPLLNGTVQADKKWFLEVWQNEDRSWRRWAFSLGINSGSSRTTALSRRPTRSNGGNWVSKGTIGGDESVHEVEAVCLPKVSVTQSQVETIFRLYSIRVTVASSIQPSHTAGTLTLGSGQ